MAERSAGILLYRRTGGVLEVLLVRPGGPFWQRRITWVEAFALEQSVDPAAVRSNRFEMEGPRGNGQLRSFPEIEEVCWFALERLLD